MKEHKMKVVELASLLHISRGAMSNILHYRRRLTAKQIRILAKHFGIRQEALNQAYELIEDKSQMVQEREFAIQNNLR